MPYYDDQYHEFLGGLIYKENYYPQLKKEEDSLAKLCYICISLLIANLWFVFEFILLDQRHFIVLFLFAAELLSLYRCTLSVTSHGV